MQEEVKSLLNGMLRGSAKRRVTLVLAAFVTAFVTAFAAAYATAAAMSRELTASAALYLQQLYGRFLCISVSYATPSCRQLSDQTRVISNSPSTRACICTFSYATGSIERGSWHAFLRKKTYRMKMAVETHLAQCTFKTYCYACASTCNRMRTSDAAETNIQMRAQRRTTQKLFLVFPGLTSVLGNCFFPLGAVIECLQR